VRKTKGDEEPSGFSLGKWRIFSPEAYREVPAWDVPWGWQTTTLGMIAWGVSFLFVGILSIPIGFKLLGVTDFKSMTAMQQSQIQLIDQVCQGFV
jgi:hypothetical protein